LSAIAVLFAVLPLALGWDSPGHRLHSYAAIWALGEVLVIGTVSAIYWWGYRRRWHGQWLQARTTAELTWYLPLLAPLLGLTALGAMLHLAVHTIWLSVITTFFPALGASLHGALAQSEAYRLGTTSERLVARLGAVIDRVRANTDASAARGDVAPLRVSIR